MSADSTPEPTASHSGRLWGGRFAGGPAEAMFLLSKADDIDWRLARYDLAASTAHAKNLFQAGLLTQQELSGLEQGLATLQQQLSSGELAPSGQDEDVHGALERLLTEVVGAELGGRLRAGRSRNDQIAGLIRLYLRDNLNLIAAELSDLIRVLANLADRHLGIAMPGRTHMQHAQPILLSHHLLAFAWPLIRDLDRIKNVQNRLQVSPYGSAALAGDSLGLDPDLMARELGFTSSVENSLDGTASRDLVTEAAYVLAQIGIDLSRIAEDVIIWVTHEFGFANLADAWSTGSSIMPQKKNPDIAELARGKAGRLIGNATALMAITKALPMAYDRDLQEDKAPVFDSVDQLLILIPAMTGMMDTLTFNLERLESLAPRGFSLATDLADWLVRQRIPFARAHDIAGAVVKFAEDNQRELDQLTPAELAQIAPELTPDVLEVLTVPGSINSRSGRGGTAETAVRDQLTELRTQLKALQT